MTKRKRTLEQRAHRAMEAPHKRFAKMNGEGEFSNGYSWGFVDGYLAGYRAGKREGMAKALKDCGWGDGSKRK